ncbi:MAG: AAA family ATPase [Paludibacteraceae bacterium]|nr:AAA family ATPase [Paludibacteraceae bacterium]
MREYLKISNFGPIIEVELDDIAPFTILVGESGSGKSTVLKVLSLFRWIFKRVVLRSYVKQANINKTGIGFQMKTLLKASGLDEFLKTNTEIVYRRNDYEIAYRNKKLNVQSSIPVSELSLEKICFISDKRSMISDFLDNKMERRIANLHLQDTMDNFLLATKFIQSFPVDYLNVKFSVEKSSAGIQYMIHGTDEGKYSIKLKNASSGTQTVLPLSMIVEYYARHFDPKKAMDSSLFQYLQDNDRLKDFNTAKNIGEIEQKNVHILIEEPELSLYPESQCQLINYLADRCIFHHPQYNMTLMMATHSPYIANYINLLLRRGQKGLEGDEVRLKPDEVNVYQIVEGQALTLKIETADGVIIDTRLMSDPISEMYQKYNNL